MATKVAKKFEVREFDSETLAGFGYNIMEPGKNPRTVATVGPNAFEQVKQEAHLLAASAVLLEACRFTLSVMRTNHDDVELSERMAIKKLEDAIAAVAVPS